MSSKTRKRRMPKPVWERGYNGHVYWQGKARLGKVTLHSDATAKHKYTWEAAGRAGAADDLEKAKRAVEAAAAMADKQLDLFG
jgi:YD repeat-containing protein